MSEIYELLFKNSSVCAGLTDEDKNVILKSARGAVPTKNQLNEAEIHPVYLPDGTTLLQCIKTDCGYFYWYEDNGELLRLNEELSDTGDYLLEESAALNEAAALEEAKKRTAEQNRLFDGISESLQPQLNKLDEILNNLPDDEPGFCRQMKYAGVLGAFIKRYSNLLLLSSSDSKTDSFELYLCINESFTYLRLLDTACYADIQQGIELPVSIELLMYGLFESVVESALTFLPAILVTLKQDEKGLTLFIETANEDAAVDESFYEAAKSAGFELHTEKEDGCLFVTLKAGSEAV